MKKLLLSLAMLLPFFGFANEVTDVLTADKFAATSTTYEDFTGVEGTSGAVYAGNSAKDKNGNIQLRSKNSTSGIVTTTSAGKVKKISITVASGSNQIDVYGKSTAYASAANLYATSAGDKGTKLGSLTETGEIVVDGDYEYIGIRSYNGALYLSKVEITWLQQAAPAVAKVVFSVPAGEYYAGQKVELSCATEGAQILYSLDGSEPATEYTEPIVLTESVTIKAIAVKGEDRSEVVSEAAYIVAPTFSMVSEILALENGAKFTCNTPLKLFYVNTSAGYFYANDAYEGCALIYKKGLELNEGDIIAAPWNGTVSIFNGAAQLVPASALAVDETGEAAVSAIFPITLTAMEVDDQLADYNLHKPVLIKNADFPGFVVGEDGKVSKEATVMVGETEVSIYNQFNLTKDVNDNVLAAGAYNIAGVINYRKASGDAEGVYRVLPTAFTAPTYELVSTPAASFEPVEEVSSLLVNGLVNDAKAAVAINEDCEEVPTLSTMFGPMDVTLNAAIVEVEGLNTLSLTLAEPITDEGSYTYRIPEGYLNIGSGINEETYFTFFISKPKEPVTLKVDPAAGVVEALETIAILAEGEDIQTARAGATLDGTEITITDGDGEVVYTSDAFELNNNCMDWDTWTFLGYNLEANITEPGTYTLNIPADYFEFENGAKSLELTAVYTIEEEEDPDEVKVVYLNGKNLDSNKSSVRKGIAGTPAEGFTLEMAGGKTFDNVTTGTLQFIIDDESYMPMKNSAGQQITCTLPEGMVAQSITLYSYINNDTDDGYWSEVAGETLDADDTYHDAHKTADYDENSFDIDNLNEFTFTGAGKQLCFVLKVEYTKAPVEEEEAPEALYLKSAPTADPIAVLEMVEEGIYEAKDVEISAMIDGEAWFSIFTNEEGTGTFYGAAYSNTYAETEVPNFMVENGAYSWNILPGTYNFTLNWEDKSFTVEKVEQEEPEGIVIYWDNTTGSLNEPTIWYYSNSEGSDYADMAPVAPAGGIELLSYSKDDLWYGYIPADAYYFGFVDSAPEDEDNNPWYEVIDPEDEEAVYVYPVENMVYGILSQEGQTAGPLGLYEGAAPATGVTVYWQNLNDILGAPAVYYITEDGVDDSEDAIETSIQGVWEIELPANVAMFAFFDAADDYNTLTVMEIDEETEEETYLAPVDGMVYRPKNIPYGADDMWIAVEYGLYDDVFAPAPEALYIKTSAEADAIAVLQKGENNTFTAEEVVFCGVEDDFAFFSIYTSDDADAEVYGADGPMVILQNGVAAKMNRGREMSWFVFNGTYKVTVDWTEKTVTLVNAAGETGEITVYFDNTRAQMSFPIVQCIDFGGGDHLVAMERCAEIPDEVVNKVRARAEAGDGTIMDYNVFSAKISTDWVLMGFYDRLDQDNMVYIDNEDGYYFASELKDGAVFDENGAVVGTFEETVTGVDSIEADAEEAVYYNLQGVRVDNPESGLYIVVRNGKISKEIRK